MREKGFKDVFPMYSNKRIMTSTDADKKELYKPKGLKPIRAGWRYRPDGSYYKGSKDLEYDAKYYLEKLKGRRYTCEICGADVAYTYKSRHLKRFYCQEIAKKKELESATSTETETEYGEFD